MPMQSQTAFGRLRRFIFYAILIMLPVVGWLYRFSVYDWYRLRNYTPTAEVITLTENTAMTNKGRRAFYANHPRIEPKDQLRADCQQNEFTIVLGCYVTGQGIFLFDVKDPRLSGVKEVTAAHEMLHAAYDRLSVRDRKKVNQLLEAELAEVTNPRILQTIDQYRQKDSSIVTNELHSILGTEVRSLSPELEAHYQQFFIDRSKVVALSEQYESEFTSRENQVEAYDQKLTSLKQQIETNEKQLSTMSASIQVERSRLSSLAASQNVGEYNAAVPGFNRQVDRYNDLADATYALIDEHNAIVGKRNELAIEVNDLSQAIDTRPQTIPAQ